MYFEHEMGIYLPLYSSIYLIYLSTLVCIDYTSLLYCVLGDV